MHLDLTITDANKDRAAMIMQARPTDRITVSFGWLETVRTDACMLANNPKAAPTRIEFRCAPSKPSRTYKTEAAARNAAAKWVA